MDTLRLVVCQRMDYFSKLPNSSDQLSTYQRSAWTNKFGSVLPTTSSNSSLHLFIVLYLKCHKPEMIDRKLIILFVKDTSAYT